VNTREENLPEKRRTIEAVEGVGAAAGQARTSAAQSAEHEEKEEEPPNTAAWAGRSLASSIQQKIGGFLRGKPSSQ
jgi:hypothetical protein